MNLDSLREQVTNLTLYDLKAGVRKVQNAVMNYTEMEAKVREATNNEPWGCPTSTMQEIANATFNYQTLNEIMPLLYKRFTDKAAEEWRQIYKALQLLEFLIKNGSERVVDDTRSHLSLLKMLRQFHYIDQNGKDQGLNVRNRAKELVELLSDVERIRAERKKSRATRNKYGGLEGGTGLGMSGSGSGSRYGGFGNQEEYGSYTGRVYGDGGGFGGDTGGGYGDTQARRERFEEYDEYDEGAVAAPARRKADAVTSPVRQQKPQPPPKKEPEVDLLSIGDDEPAATTATSNGRAQSSASTGGRLAAVQTGGADDEFDDFQSATTPSSSIPTTTSTQFAAPQPRSANQGSNINSLFASISPRPSNTSTPTNLSAFSPPTSKSQLQQLQQQKPAGYQPAQPNYYTSVPLPPQPQQTGTSTTPMSGITSPGQLGKPTSSGNKPAAGTDAFASLWSTAGGDIKKSTTPSGKGPALADMAKQQASAGIWGTTAMQSPSPASSQKPSGARGGAGGSNDLLG